MKNVKFEVVINMSDSTEEGSARYEKVCRYLLQKFFEGREGYEGCGLSEGFYGGSSGKRLFNTSTEG